jgi:hypothetical protein
MVERAALAIDIAVLLKRPGRLFAAVKYPCTGFRRALHDFRQAGLRRCGGRRQADGEGCEGC